MPNERLMERLAAQGILNEEDIPPELIEAVTSHDWPSTPTSTHQSEPSSVIDDENPRPLVPCDHLEPLISQVQESASTLIDTSTPTLIDTCRTGQSQSSSAGVYKNPCELVARDHLESTTLLNEPASEATLIDTCHTVMLQKSSATEYRSMTDVVMAFGESTVTAQSSPSFMCSSNTPKRLIKLATPKRKLSPEKAIESPHNKLRKIAEENFLQAANRQQVNFDRKKGAMKEDYSVGDTVGIRIPKIDRTNISKKILPCKVIEKTNDKFRLYTTSGILNTTFAHTDMIDFRNVLFNDLESADPTSMEKIAFTKASRDISGFTKPNESATICNCKGKCVNNRCSCRKNKLNCSTKCHTEFVNCSNK